MEGSGNDDINEGLHAIMEIFEVILEIKSASDRFEGACMDSGAQRIVIGKPQAELYATFSNVKVESSTPKRAYRFKSISRILRRGTYSLLN